MIFIFVSECEKKSHCKTRRVLDAFCLRIGSYTWISNLTQAGIEALYSELRKTASKNTSVSCHKISRKNHELQWIVGNKNKFNEHGMVPINYTELENLPLIGEGE